MRLFLFLLIAVASFACRTSSKLTSAAYQRLLKGFPHPSYWLGGENLVPLVSAHRGQPEIAGYPENAVSSLTYLTSQGSFIVEVDVALSADSVLFLFHDDDLDRLTTQTGSVSELPWSQLDTMRLRDRFGRLTQETIPSFAEALAALAGKALVTLDLKGGVPIAQVFAEVEQHGNPSEVAIIAYDDDDLSAWEKAGKGTGISYTPQTPRQLRAVAKRSAPMPLVIFGGVGKVSRTLTSLSNRLDKRVIVGTFGALDDRAVLDAGETYLDFLSQGISVIATNRPLAAYDVMYDRAKALNRIYDPDAGPQQQPTPQNSAGQTNPNNAKN